MTITSTTQLPLPFDGLEIRPTPAMVRGDQHAHQCAWCGTVVIVPTGIDGTRRPLRGKACPACDQTDHGWWKADIDGQGIAGFRLVTP
jgi:hypothetical protein